MKTAARSAGTGILRGYGRSWGRKIWYRTTKRTVMLVGVAMVEVVLKSSCLNRLVLSQAYLKFWIWVGAALFISNCIEWGRTLNLIYVFVAMLNGTVAILAILFHDAGGFSAYIDRIIEARRQIKQREREEKYPYVDREGMRWRRDGGRLVSEISDLILEEEEMGWTGRSQN